MTKETRRQGAPTATAPSIDPPNPSAEWLRNFLMPTLIEAPAYKIDTPECAIKLDQNESPKDWPEALKSRVTRALAEAPWNRYPSSYSDELAAKVAAYSGVDPRCVLLGPGSNYLIALILSTFTRRLTGKVVIARPSFALYESHCKYEGIPYELWNLNAELEYDIRQLPPLTPGTLVVFASPNNPVGNVLPRRDLKALLTMHPDVLFIADEAYFEYATEPYTDLLREFDNLILIRTFSKTMGAAGVRLGYVMAPRLVIQQLKKLRLPYLLNLFTLIAADEVLSDASIAAHFKQTVATSIEERERVFADLQTVAQRGGFRVQTSQANFILVRWTSQERCTAAYLAMVAKGVLVRNVSGAPGLTGCLRVTIGTRQENDAFLDAARTVWGA